MDKYDWPSLGAVYLGVFVWLILVFVTECLIGLEFTSTIGWPLSPKDLPVSVCLCDYKQRSAHLAFYVGSGGTEQESSSLQGKHFQT